MAGIYTYRVEDGRDVVPPINATVFVVMDPAGNDLIGSWGTCHSAREFCAYRNRKMREANTWRMLNAS